MRVDQQALKPARDCIRRLTACGWVVRGAQLQALNTFIVGWSADFALASTPSVFERLDGWLLRRLRQVR